VGSFAFRRTAFAPLPPPDVDHDGRRALRQIDGG
jgi:hypothetical protein